MKQSIIITAVGAAGLGALIWLMKQPSVPSTVPTIPNQDGRTIAFPAPNYTAPDNSNPAQQFAPFAFSGSQFSAVPAPVRSADNSPTYLTYNFGDDGGLQFPVVGAVGPLSPPINTTLGDILGLLTGTPKPTAKDSGCGCGCSGGASKSCNTCTDGGAGSLVASPVQYVQALVSAMPDYVKSFVKNAKGSNLPINTPARGNPFNGRVGAAPVFDEA